MRCMTVHLASASLRGSVRGGEYRGRAAITLGRDYGRASTLGELPVRGPAYSDFEWARLEAGELVPSTAPVDDGLWLVVVYGDTSYHRFLPPRPLVGWPREVNLYKGNALLGSYKVPKGVPPTDVINKAGHGVNWNDPDIRITIPRRHPLPRCIVEGWTAFGDAGRLGGAGHGVFVMRPGDIVGGDQVVRAETGGWTTRRLWGACGADGPVLVTHADLVAGRAALPAECVCR